MNEDWQHNLVIDINAPSLPKAIRQHALSFKNPGKFVIEMGDGEYVLYTEDGDLLDLFFVK